MAARASAGLRAVVSLQHVLALRRRAIAVPAQGSGLAASRRPYHDTVFRRFWSHELEIDEAEALGVFGVPTMVFNGELFWGGDRIDLLIQRIKNPESIATALGSRHRK
jgi:2-hydroxychromene-2-carboxylate isomerase